MNAIDNKWSQNQSAMEVVEYVETLYRFESPFSGILHMSLLCVKAGKDLPLIF